MSVLFYRRPAYVERTSGPLNPKDCQRYVDRMKSCKNPVPPELSFERVVNNETLPPCQLNDFMDYLIYVAHDAENLQFYLWLRDYTKKFERLKLQDQSLSPEWEPVPHVQDDHGRRSKVPNGTTVEINFDKKDQLEIPLDDLPTPTRSEFGGSYGPSLSGATDYESFVSRSIKSQKSLQEIAEEANNQVGLKWQSFSIQPFRSEITKVIATYLAPSAPRELNLSHRERTAVLHALQHTTHPSALAPALALVESVLRGQAHPNFVRWSICNGNKPRVFFVRAMGVSHTLAGILITAILTLSAAPRWWRILPALVTFIGIGTLVAAYKGLCVIMYSGGHGRELKPWEDAETVSLVSSTNTNKRRSGRILPPDDEEATLAGSIGRSMKRPKSMETFGTTNTYTDEAWIENFRKRSLMQKIFGPKTAVQEQAIRIIQDRIVLQSQIWALLLTIVITVVFVVLPAGMFF
ncbi:hypothetical protein P152DRAFT_240440 [Eremomyces bilateralis CBS 781.70]|uniref:Regulator of G protein signaling superfamily n=1 Tax=Eremomyces bilateralis CBS 781.70 TaxID=1392243 RepID=A0A6G1GAD9_9PEZI|nr:uncharacterized protein P152DRAFT_240440 [Eremomyces bilateralis CBS 781.70]KAF1814972.1 hypothetical protein P152DRAFT_240440 [Eremomyces bilateralis CBS 781.70]